MEVDAVSWFRLFQTDHPHRALSSAQMHLVGMDAVDHMALLADTLANTGKRPVRPGHQNGMCALPLLPNAHQADLLQRPVGGVGRQRGHGHGRGQARAFRCLGA